MKKGEPNEKKKILHSMFERSARENIIAPKLEDDKEESYWNTTEAMATKYHNTTLFDILSMK